MKLKSFVNKLFYVVSRHMEISSLHRRIVDEKILIVCHRHGGNYDNMLRYYRLSHDVVISDQHHAMRSPD